MTKLTHRKSNGIRNRFKCSRCKKGYSSENSYKNHIKHCIDGK